MYISNIRKYTSDFQHARSPSSITGLSLQCNKCSTFVTLKHYHFPLPFSNAIPEHIVTKHPFRYKSGSCSRNHTRIAVSASSLLWYRQTPKCCFSCPHKWQSVLPSHPLLYVLARPARSSSWMSTRPFANPTQHCWICSTLVTPST